MGDYYQPQEISSYVKRVSRYGYLSLEEELELARQYRKGDSKAGETLVKANLRNVVKAAKPFFYQGHNPLEIIQEGNVGLMRALPLFDPDRGIKFFSYAVWWVRCYIMNYLSRTHKPHTGMLGLAPNVVSLDTAVSSNSSTEECFVNHLADDAPSQEEELITRQEPVILQRILGSNSCPLTDRELYVLRRRYLDEPRPTLGQVARVLKITKERVRQIENKSLEKMRNHIRVKYSLEREDFISDDRIQYPEKGLFPQPGHASRAYLS